MLLVAWKKNRGREFQTDSIFAQPKRSVLITKSSSTHELTEHVQKPDTVFGTIDYKFAELRINSLFEQPKRSVLINKKKKNHRPAAQERERGRERGLPELVLLARGREGGAGDLLSVEAEGADERVVLAARESSGDRLR